MGIETEITGGVREVELLGEVAQLLGRVAEQKRLISSIRQDIRSLLNAIAARKAHIERARPPLRPSRYGLCDTGARASSHRQTSKADDSENSSILDNAARKPLPTNMPRYCAWVSKDTSTMAETHSERLIREVEALRIKVAQQQNQLQETRAQYEKMRESLRELGIVEKPDGISPGPCTDTEHA